MARSRSSRFAQQNNIIKGRRGARLKPLAQHGEYMTCVADLFVRMTCKAPAARLVIAEVVSHPVPRDN
jgi:hypothetical protein